MLPFGPRGQSWAGVVTLWFCWVVALTPRLCGMAFAPQLWSQCQGLCLVRWKKGGGPDELWINFGVIFSSRRINSTCSWAISLLSSLVKSTKSHHLPSFPLISRSSIWYVSAHSIPWGLYQVRVLPHISILFNMCFLTFCNMDGLRVVQIFKFWLLLFNNFFPFIYVSHLSLSICSPQEPRHSFTFA